MFERSRIIRADEIRYNNSARNVFGGFHDARTGGKSLLDEYFDAIIV